MVLRLPMVNDIQLESKYGTEIFRLSLKDMNAEFGWSIAIIIFGLLLGGIAIALYVYWKDRSDFKKEGEVIVWSVVIAAFVVLLVGLAMMVWSISKRADKDVSERSLQEQITAAPPGPRFTVAAPATLPEPTAPATLVGSAATRATVVNAEVGETSESPTPKPILRRRRGLRAYPTKRVRFREPSVVNVPSGSFSSGNPFIESGTASRARLNRFGR